MRVRRSFRGVRRNYLFQRAARHTPRSRLGVVVPGAETFFFFFNCVARGGQAEVCSAHLGGGSRGRAGRRNRRNPLPPKW